MQFVSTLLPPSYVFEGMRSVLAGQRISPNTVLVGGGLAIVYILLACWVFARTYRYAVRTGLLARYSAESVG